MKQHEAIRAAREAAGKSIRETAAYLDIADARYEAIEAGALAPTVRQTLALSSYLDVAPGALCGRAPSMQLMISPMDLEDGGYVVFLTDAVTSQDIADLLGIREIIIANKPEMMKTSKPVDIAFHPLAAQGQLIGEDPGNKDLMLLPASNWSVRVGDGMVAIGAWIDMNHVIHYVGFRTAEPA